MKSYVILIFLTCPYLLAQEVNNLYDLSTSTVTSSGDNCGDIKSTLVAFASMTFLVFEISQLLGELQSLKGELQSVKGELQSVKGELQSVKGELQSLQTQQMQCNAQLQSLRQQLNTCNSQLNNVQQQLTTCNQQLAACNSQTTPSPQLDTVCPGQLATCNTQLTSFTSQKPEMQRCVVILGINTCNVDPGCEFSCVASSVLALYI